MPHEQNDNIDFTALRQKMVAEQLIVRDINDERILRVFGAVPREYFIPEDIRAHAYEDRPLPIQLEQTISQPYIVALMTQLLNPHEGERVLEIGTGSGYQTAVLLSLGADVFTVERFEGMAEAARAILKQLGYIPKIKVGDGTLGWPEHGPYNKIIVTAAGKHIPPPLLEQLAVGGTMVIPLGGAFQQHLTLIKKVSETKIEQEVICGCVFVPLIGRYGHQD